MGLPYSKQIHTAFDQVTPLVAAGFEVLRTTKNIAVFLAFLQVFVAVVLTLNLCALLGLIMTVNPELELERTRIVTPVLKWLAGWVLQYAGTMLWLLKLGIVLSTAAGGVAVWQGSLAGTRVPGEGSEGVESEKGGETGEVGDG
ncbi:hypothetical protein BKA67DRAFT_539412 [Truncatella angustata]|uniref:Uncharacterized protein n=1 Tax=Truncatella angustata TaxID=152316 RepID=A0A9P8UCK2_9PEZI|nr:uncharacterized protein BKA67DRAFT_539412 [Truncatella angustata]KAH6647554.1 hypothetical protein BKA67DRAFT_539412 [Truncatella angustata]KAH8194809.1 hypothetical protein TruAng_011020 [Truncatella angustata]